LFNLLKLVLIDSLSNTENNHMPYLVEITALLISF